MAVLVVELIVAYVIAIAYAATFSAEGWRVIGPAEVGGDGDGGGD
jgi:hypothetical protein